MRNWFASCKYPFRLCILPNGQIDTDSFLLACDEFVQILDLIGKYNIFYPIKSRYRYDCELIMTNHMQTKQIYTLEQLIANERQTFTRNCSHESCLHACRGLRFLNKAFIFLDEAFNNFFKNNSLELRECFRTVYPYTLGKLHMEITKKLFMAAMGAVPDNRIFIPMLQGSDTYEQTLKDALDYFKTYGIVRKRVEEICIRNKIDH